MKNSPVAPPVWRSILYVPAHLPRFVAKAATCAADAVLLDLEDSVPAELKVHARGGLRAAVAALKTAPLEVLVRVNGPLQLMVPDLDAAVAAGADGVALPKLRGASHLEAIDELLSTLEDEHGVEAGTTRVIPMIETPRAFDAMTTIARASSRVAGMMLGGGDFALHCGSEASPEVLRLPKQMLVIAARAAGVPPLGLVGTPDELADLDAFEQMARQSKEMGFAGATCIHPSQVAPLNRAFAPSERDVLLAQAQLNAYETARAAGHGAARVAGKMIDAPVIERARQVLAQHEAIAQRSR